MLTSLQIQNYALIENLQMEWHPGFAVITGETGAGKSIILGAIHLLLGHRADMKAIKKGAKRCTIEAEFELESYGMEPWFEENDFPYDKGHCIIRREVMTTGKSCAFINDTPAQLTLMRELGEQLIDVHSQHQNLLLGKEDFQLYVLDLIGHTQAIQAQYNQSYEAWRKSIAALKTLREKAFEAQKDQDYKHFLLQEFEEAQLKSGEQEQLEIDIERASHSQDILQTMQRTHGRLEAEESGILEGLREIRNELSQLEDFMPEAKTLQERVESCRIELKDISAEAESIAESVEHNPVLLLEMEQRLDLINSLLQKHRVQTMDELLQVWEDISNELSTISAYDDEIALLETNIEKHYQEALTLSIELTKLRQKAGEEIAQKMVLSLKPLGMPHVRFEASIIPRKELGPKGADTIQYLFSANKNGALERIDQVASGGEIARVMLCLKALIADIVKMPTIIFDEIDTGVSGEIATKMAHIMQDMGAHKRQVLSITHLPQIAAMGSTHYRVYKEDTDTETNSHMIELDRTGRIQEIAHMLSGAHVTQAALENAEELLMTNQLK